MNLNLEEIREHYDELQTRVWTEEEEFTNYEICLANQIGEIIDYEEKIVETEISDALKLKDLNDKSNERLYEVKTINGLCLDEKCDKSTVKTYHLTFAQAIDFIRGTIFVAEEFLSIKPL